MTITLGWWLAPSLLTLALFAWAFWPSHHIGWGGDIIAIIQFMAASIVSLMAWLVWSLAA